MVWWVSHNTLLTKHRSVCHSNAIWDLIWGPGELLVIQNRFLHKDHEANKRSQWSDESQSWHPPAQPTSADMSVRLVWTGKSVCCCVFFFNTSNESTHQQSSNIFFQLLNAFVTQPNQRYQEASLWRRSLWFTESPQEPSSTTQTSFWSDRALQKYLL